MSNIRKNIQLLALLPIPFSEIFGNVDQLINPKAEEKILAEYEISLDNRYDNEFVNAVFKDNILLNLSYMQGKQIDAKNINWDEIRSNFTYEFRLDPNKAFAFHDDVFDKYRERVMVTTNAHFNSKEGFKTDGYLFGDGVCHLASLINIVAQKASLDVEAPTPHDFAPIPDIPKEYGVSIYSNPYAKGSNSQQNLYITNNKGKPVTFKFEYNGDKVKVSIVEGNWL